MLKELEQMHEISKALMEAADKGDVDRVIELLKHRKELSEKMGQLNPSDPDVVAGKVAPLLKQIIMLDGELEGKIRSLMNDIQKAIMAVQGEQNVIKNYLKETDSVDPKFIDREG
jgi:hypothetical protein